MALPELAYSVLLYSVVMSAFVESLHFAFAKALAEEDYARLSETSGELCRTYLQMGNVILAQKWFHEHRLDLCMNMISPQRSHSERN